MKNQPGPDHRCRTPHRQQFPKTAQANRLPDGQVNILRTFLADLAGLAGLQRRIRLIQHLVIVPSSVGQQTKWLGPITHQQQCRQYQAAPDHRRQPPPRHPPTVFVNHPVVELRNGHHRSRSSEADHPHCQPTTLLEPFAHQPCRGQCDGALANAANQREANREPKECANRGHPQAGQPEQQPQRWQQDSRTDPIQQQANTWKQRASHQARDQVRNRIIGPQQPQVVQHGVNERGDGKRLAGSRQKHAQRADRQHDPRRVQKSTSRNQVWWFRIGVAESRIGCRHGGSVTGQGGQ